MGIVFGLLAAVLYGSGDYLGGRASDGGDVRRVLVASQSAALVAALALVMVVHGEIEPRDLGYGAAAGLSTAIGLGLLYRGLAIGRAGVVAPITAIVGAVVPVVWGITTGERPSALAMAGVVAAVIAAGLVARGRDRTERNQSGAGIAVASGLALGVNFIFYAATSDDSGFWPLLAARLVAIPAAALAVLLARDGLARVRLTALQLRYAIAAGACDAAGTVSLITGVRTELAVLVAAVTALTPGFTVAWAWLLQKERLDRVQALGVALALVGLVVIAAG